MFLCCLLLHPRHYKKKIAVNVGWNMKPIFFLDHLWHTFLPFPLSIQSVFLTQFACITLHVPLPSWPFHFPESSAPDTPLVYNHVRATGNTGDTFVLCCNRHGKHRFQSSVIFPETHSSLMNLTRNRTTKLIQTSI